jgi:PEGA domain
MAANIRAATLGLWLAAVSITTSAVALPPPNAEAAAEAARLDASATKLAKAGATREALAALRRSEELAPRRATLDRIAALQRQEKDFAGAYATLVEMLSRFDSELKPKDRADIRHSMDELAAITGAVHLTVAEAGARVEVDGNAIGDGPIDTKIRVNLGMHGVKVTKPHYETFEWRGDVAAGAETQVVAALKATPGSLTVRVQGAPTTVRIDGNDVGPAPWHGPLPPGKHVVEIGEPGKVKREVEIAPGEEASVDLEGETRGRLTISVEPANASIHIDGQVRGVGQWEGPVDPGPHQIEVTADGYEMAFLTVQSSPGLAKSERIQLRALIPPVSFDGVYAILAGGFMGSPSANNFITDACSLDDTTCTGGRGGYGAEIPIRVGYSFGYLGVEGMIAVRYDQMNMTSDTSATPFPRRTVGFMVYRVTVANGVAVRFMPKTQGARLSTALGLAWAHEIIGLSADVHGGHDFPHPSANGTSPMLLFDAGVLLGDTPGAKFRLAFESSVEFIGNGFTDPKTPTVPLARGTIVFLGPSLGVQIGH